MNRTSGVREIAMSMSLHKLRSNSTSAGRAVPGTNTFSSSISPSSPASENSFHPLTEANHSTSKYIKKNMMNNELNDNHKLIVNQISIELYLY